MASPGFVYVLVNPALPGLVKVGKTGRAPDQRARELQGTGLPTPFAVAHEVYVEDCELVERSVHALLDGHRVADNREFFSISIEDAVAAISLASHLYNPRAAKNASDPQTELDLLGVQQAVLDEADDYRFGVNGRLRDPERALRTYEKAVVVGAIRAYWSIGDLLLMRAKTDREYAQAVSWLQKGADRGYRWCWSRLADYYLERHLYSSDPDGEHNVRICLGNLLRDIEPEWIEDDDNEREIFFRLCDYVHLCLGNPSRAELSAIDGAFATMATKVATLTDTNEQSARRIQLDEVRLRVASLKHRIGPAVQFPSD